MKNTVKSYSVTGTLKVPTSKSYAQRAIFAALLAEGESELRSINWSDDTLHALHAAISLGAEIRYIGDTLYIKGSRTPRNSAVYAGESGLTGRILSSVLLIYPEEMTLSGSTSLQERPFAPMASIYSQLGLDYSMNNDSLPIRVTGAIHSRDIELDGSESSQYLTGLLTALPAVDFRHRIKVTNATSKPYIDMSIALLKNFGVHWNESSEFVYQLELNEYKAADYTVEGDWSGASFGIVAACIAGDLKLTGLNKNSLQADRAILDIPGLNYEWEGDDLNVNRQELAGFIFDATHCPDLFPPLVALACHGTSESEIKGVSRLRHKESDRASVLLTEYEKLGIEISIKGDSMIIKPGQILGGIVDSHNDHRIAMSVAVAAALAGNPVVINGMESVSKSYPSFLKDYSQIGANFEWLNQETI